MKYICVYGMTPQSTGGVMNTNNKANGIRFLSHMIKALGEQAWGYVASTTENLESFHKNPDGVVARWTNGQRVSI